MRKTEVFVVVKDNRDKGKRFLITEAAALKVEKWATRAMLALARSGHDIPHVKGAGVAALVVSGLEALQRLDFADAEPLLDEMMECVQIVPDPKHPETARPLVERGSEGDDIEEIDTRIEIRKRIFNLHTGFFTPAAP